MNTVKNLCDKIEELMVTHNNELLYESVMSELGSIDYSVIFIQLNKLPLYRLRPNNDKEIFKEAQHIYHAPDKCISSYGRVNKIGQSMFYCSESLSNCELELLDRNLKGDVGKEQFFTASEWQIQQDLNMLIIAIAPSSKEVSNGFTLRNECFQFVKSEPNASQRLYSNFYNLTKHFLLQNAKDKPKLYVVCSAIANYFTNLFPNIDGIIYPSVMSSSGYNIVLRPHALINKMIVPKADVTMRKWTVTTSNKYSADSNIINGKIIDDKIHWSNSALS